MKVRSVSSNFFSAPYDGGVYYELGRKNVCLKICIRSSFSYLWRYPRNILEIFLDQILVAAIIIRVNKSSRSHFPLD